MLWQSLLLSEICDFQHRGDEILSDAAVRRVPWVLVLQFLLTQPLPALPGKISSASWKRAQEIPSEMTYVRDCATAVLRLRILVMLWSSMVSGAALLKDPGLAWSVWSCRGRVRSKIHLLRWVSWPLHPAASPFRYRRVSSGWLNHQCCYSCRPLCTRLLELTGTSLLFHQRSDLPSSCTVSQDTQEYYFRGLIFFKVS